MRARGMSEGRRGAGGGAQHDRVVRLVARSAREVDSHLHPQEFPQRHRAHHPGARPPEPRSPRRALGQRPLHRRPASGPCRRLLSLALSCVPALAPLSRASLLSCETALALLARARPPEPCSLVLGSLAPWSLAFASGLSPCSLVRACSRPALARAHSLVPPALACSIYLSIYLSISHTLSALPHTLVAHGWVSRLASTGDSRTGGSPLPRSLRKALL